MLEQLVEYLPNIIAGLVPSLISVIPTVVVILKNIKVNRQVEELQSTVADFASGKISLEQSITKTQGIMESAVKDVTGELTKVYETAKDAIERDALVIQNNVAQTVKSAEVSMQSVQNSISHLMEEVIRRGYVHQVQQEGQTEISNSED